MITVLDNLSWSQADLAGNGEFIEVGGAIYVVSNVRSNNTFRILKSISAFLGQVFTVVSTYTFPAPNQEFAPCVAYDPITNKLHIVGLQNNPTNGRLFDLLKWTVDLTAPPVTLPAPTVLATSELIRSGFDVIVLANSHPVIGAILTNPATPVLLIPTGHSLVIFERDTADAPVSTVQLQNSPNRAPNPATLVTYNSLSMVSPDGVNIELYYEQHPRVITFADQLFQIFFGLRNALSQWTPIISGNFAPTPIDAFTGRYSDDRLTVIPDALGSRFLSQTFYNQFNIPEGIVGNLLLGHLQGGPAWSALTLYVTGNIVSYQGVSYTAIAGSLGMVPPTSPAAWQTTPFFFHVTPGSVVGGSIAAATLSVDLAGEVTAAYLLEDLLTGQVGGPGFPLKLASVNLADLSLTDVPGWYNAHNFTWLRGSKLLIDNPTTWAVVAEEQTSGPTVDIPSFVSGLNVPPIASLLPASVNATRGTPVIFDASGSFDPDGDPIVYGWSYAVTNPNVTLTSSLNGTHATLNVAQAIGGGPKSFIVTVSEADTFAPFAVQSIQVSSNLLTVFAAGHNFVATNNVAFENVANAGFLNGQIVQVGSAVPGVSFTATFTAPDYGPIPESTATVGLVRHLPAGSAVASSSVNVPFNAPPTVSIAGPIAAARNAQVTIVPVYTGVTDPDDTTTYLWTQVSGDTVAPLSFTTPTFTFPTNGLAVDGEALVFSVKADDGVTTDWSALTTYQIQDSVFSAGNVYTAINVNSNDLPPSPNWTFVGINPASVTVNVAAFSNPNKDTLRISRGIFYNQGRVTNVAYNGTIATVTMNPAMVTPFLPGELVLLDDLVANAFLNDLTWSVLASPAPTTTSWSFNFVHPVASIPDTGLASTVAGISQRNFGLDWSFLGISGIWSNLQSVKRVSIIGGNDRYIIISPASVLVYGGVMPNVILLRRCLLPDNNTILDAVHTEQDYTLVLSTPILLGGPNLIYRYTTSNFVDTDNPDTVLNVGTFAPEMSFTKITSTVVHNNIRVLALSGPQGCLLLQVNSQTLAVEAFQTISVESHTLYGADNILWLRMANVESTKSGNILIGSTDGTDTFETLYNLTFGLTLGIWDKTKLINQFVNTGEILFASISAYSGFPTAPVLNVPTLSGVTVNLTWEQVRPDLINSYQVFYSSDGGVTYTEVLVGAGTIQALQIQLLGGSLYQFYMTATNNDGVSAASNIVSIMT